MVLVVLFVVIIICGALWQRKKREEKNKLGAGLQIFDANGNLTLDTTDSSIFIYGTVCTGTSVGRIEDARIKKDKVFISPYKCRRALRDSNNIIENENESIKCYPIVFTINDGVITWDWKKWGGNLDDDRDFITVTWFVYGGTKDA